MKYSKEFKEEALKLSDEIGLKKAAQQLGIQYYTLSDWRTKRNAAAKAKKYQMTDDEAKLRITELERENAELRKANGILKDALGFFAKDRKKERHATVTCSSTSSAASTERKQYADF